MSNKVISTVLVFGCLLGIVNIAAAIPNSALKTNQFKHDPFKQFADTYPLAEQIWDQLTSEFVNYYENGSYARAALAAKQAYEIASSVFGPNHINTADSMLKLGIISEMLGDLENAKSYMLSAKSVLEIELGPYHEDVAVVLTNLANVYYEESNADLSEKYHLQALKIRRDMLGENDPAVAQSLYNLAVLYDDTGTYDKAGPFYEQAIRIWNGSYGAAHPYVANALNNLANVYLAQDKFEIAEQLHKHSLSIRKVLYGDIHAEVARSLINLGALYVKQSNYESAKPVYKEAVNVAEKLFGPAHPQVAMLLYSLANIYHIQGRMDKNEEQQLSTKRVSLTVSSDSNDIDSQIHTLHQSSQDYFSKAVPLYERALNILDTTIGTNHPAMTAMISELALLYRSLGKVAKAEKMQARLSQSN